MRIFAFLFVLLLLVSVVGCSSGDSVSGPDTSEQIQTNDTAQKPDVPHEPPGDPTDGLGGPK
jgi:hypothetical protein